MLKDQPGITAALEQFVQKALADGSNPAELSCALTAVADTMSPIMAWLALGLIKRHAISYSGNGLALALSRCTMQERRL
jgi:hypothetical protein